MITTKNLTFVFDDITKEQVKELEKHLRNNDRFILALNVCNAGASTVLYFDEDFDNEEEKEEVIQAGNVELDMDDFLRLFEESESINPYIIEAFL